MFLSSFQIMWYCFAFALQEKKKFKAITQEKVKTTKQHLKEILLKFYS